MENSDLPESILIGSKEAVLQTLPDKSGERYEKAYQKFMEWRASEKTISFVEDVFLAYFNKLAQTMAPSTLWSIYSMLKATINCNHNVDISRYGRLIAFLKKKKDGFVSKKSNVFTAVEIKKFMMEAPDSEYLAIKAVTAFGMCGAVRGDEKTNVRMEYVKDYGTEIVVRIPDSKTKVAKVFPITGEFGDFVRKYVGLRPKNISTDKFFIQLRGGKCVGQNIGKHAIAKMPRKIAEFLKLPDAERYTGHSFRRTSTTILADAGAAIETIKRHGVWKSSTVAEGYIQESLGNKRKITSTITSAINLDPLDQQPTIGDSAVIEASLTISNSSEPTVQRDQQVTGYAQMSSGIKRSAMNSEGNGKQLKIGIDDGVVDDFDENVPPRNKVFSLSQQIQATAMEKSVFNLKGCQHFTINFGKK